MGFEPKIKDRNRLKIQCPFRFILEQDGFKADCIGYKCAFWLPIQKACSLQVIARGISFPKGEY